MKKILFLPLFRMPSGHHHVADALMEGIQNRSNELEVKKLDFLSEISPFLETFVSSLYLKWIQYSPKSYNLAYRHFSYTKSNDPNPFLWYELLFIHEMEQIVKREQPSLIVCTHGFPSYFISRLKMKNRLNVPVINVYTDFFINDIWGKKGIDYHFVPNLSIKNQLEENHLVDADQILCSGIPVHEVFNRKEKSDQKKEGYSILLAGGSSGLGNMDDVINEVNELEHVATIKILCGNNHELYERIRSLNNKNVIPVPYLSSKQEMNELYEECDAIVTKPGGITISEALKKRLPIFIHSRLPGQEKVNEEFLTSHGLAFQLYQGSSYVKQVIEVLNNEDRLAAYYSRTEAYNQQMNCSVEAMYSLMDSIIHQEQETYVIDRSWKDNHHTFLKKMVSKYTN